MVPAGLKILQQPMLLLDSSCLDLGHTALRVKQVAYRRCLLPPWQQLHCAELYVAGSWQRL